MGGGDNSNRAQGTFYEGFPATGYATGYATDATDAAIQANIVAVNYAGFSTPHALCKSGVAHRGQSYTQ